MSETKTVGLSDSRTVNLTDHQDSKAAMPLTGDLMIPDHGISFYSPRLSRALIVPDSADGFFIGRSIEKASYALLLNLEDLNGFEMGVSRHHAFVRPIGHGYEVMDLASRNGTWLYDQRLIPHKSVPMPSGSLLRIGQERLLVRYRST